MTSDKKNAILGRSALVATTLMWGTSFVILKGTLNEIPALYGMALRFTGAALIMLLAGLREFKKLDRGCLKGGAVMGVCLFMAYMLQTYGLLYTTPGKNAFLTATYVVIVPFINWFIVRTRPDRYNVIAASVCLAGMALVSLTERLTIGLGDGLTACCGLFFALHIVATFHYAEGRSTVLINLVQFAVVAALSWILAPALDPFPVSAGSGALWSVAYLSVVCTAACFFLQTFGQKHTPPSAAAVILTLESVFGAAISAAFYNEALSARVLLGFFLIFSAVFISETKLSFIRYRRRNERG